ncbi:Crp/Fnr family transcriptional regulator [Moheibacter sediminis]|uniref:cAMP-binding domain of CRP or a regulatory subunit of cAMP-dependent protein kinases n=1 Tax=Moheibacter sediminis TaxID=1434700 RepID=A0A1W1YIN5_9FLAO|nr:Crp/Fnr family transcriptional regulator [Moheibacter sediminis]SMC36037.1 cAMP-binding domain of CRP or a regulatory subunit of cAMP-dependent protein kinases [Moheibacter sediminis]
MSDILENVDNICTLFENPEILKYFSKEELAELSHEKKIISFKKGDLLIEEGATPKGIYYIDKGTAKMFKLGFNGKEQILRFIKTGDILGYRSILSKQPYGASATAMEDTEVCFIPEKFFIKVLEHHPKLSFDILRRISEDLGESAQTITFLAQKTVRERLAEVLLLLEKKLGVDKDGFIKISLTREEMANLIGTATESAIRLISEFKTDNLIEVEGRKIKILAHQKLTKLGHVN